MKVVHLRCEYFENPLGIDVARPRLSWQLQSDRQGARQTAYQIIVEGGSPSTDPLDETGEVLWDSGKVNSSQSIHVEYEGPPLASGQRIHWCVRAWDENDQPTDLSQPAWWEIGLLNRADWIGQWIGAPFFGGPRTTSPAPFLRKAFRLDQPVVSARLYATALGLYEFEFNGQRVGEDVFTPGWTDYRTRLAYQVYDVTDHLQMGDNALGAILGDGWYCGHLGWGPRQQYGDRPKLLAQLLLRFADGAAGTIATDGSWRVSAGPILESDLLMGESYDARREFPGWSAPGFDDSGWQPAETFADVDVALVARRGPAVRAIQELQPIADPLEIPQWPVSKWVFDLGQNMVGRVRLKVNGPVGATITLRHAEVLDANGALYTANLRSARATDHYTLKGDGEEVYEPRFTFHGFRYVELSGYPGKPRRDTVTGIVLHSDTPPIGAFECSDPLINQLQHNIVWGQKGNFLEVPTDCPQRDERLGWTGDAQVFVRTAAFNMNVAAFFTKWQQDFADAQSEAGQFPMVIPNPARGQMADGGPAWADAGIICPWTIYVCYGDTRLLADHYGSFVRFVDYLQQSSPGLIRCHPKVKGFQGFGDWLAMDGSGKVEGRTPKDLIGTAFLVYSAGLLADIAAALGKGEDATRYSQLADQGRAAFVHRFVTPHGLVVGHTQTAYVLALHFDLLPESLRAAALDALVSDIEQRGWHLSTGFVGSPYLMDVLSRFDRLDVAYKLLSQKTCPSWLYPVTQGATTIWERWDGWTPDKGFQDAGMNSFNHYAYGSIGAWLYSVVAGIGVDPTQPAYKHIIFRPRPGCGLTSAKATLNSMYGLIVSEWKIENGDDERRHFEWDIVVPPNTTATVYLPGETEGRQVEAGRHHFSKIC